MSVGRSGDRMNDNCELLNETYVVQARNIQQGNTADAAPDSGRQFQYENLLSNIGAETVGPPRGYNWDVHQIQYDWEYVTEDSVGANPSEHAWVLVQLSEDETASFNVLAGANLEDHEFGNVQGDVADGAISAQATVDEGPWLSWWGEHTYPIVNDANGQAAGYKLTEASGVWNAPKPVFITDRTQLDVHLVGHDAADTIQQDTQGQFACSFTVWYEEYDDPDSCRR